MINVNKPILTLILWIGLPMVIWMTGSVFEFMNFQDSSAVLLLMYIIFSWSIAVLIFTVETLRQNIFKPLVAFRGGIRLAIYAGIAALLAIMTNPAIELASANSLLIILVMGLYGFLAGFLYQQFYGSGQ